MAQAFGHGDHRLLRSLLNKQIFLSLMIWCILAIPMWFMPNIYNWIGIDPEISAYAVNYVRIVFPSTLFYFGNQTLFSYCAAQKIVRFVLIATVAGTVAHGLLIYLLCFVWNWGFNGIMWATAGNFFTRFMLQIILISSSSLIPKVYDVPFLSKETVSGLKPLIQINLTSGMMGVWSIWCLDIFTLIASTMSTEQFAA